MGLDTSKKVGRSNSETLMATPPPPPHCCDEKPLQRKVVGETKAETVSLLSASIETCCPNSVHFDLLRSELAAIKPLSDFTSLQYHILAVDDSRFDLRVIEKFLKTSSCKVTTVSNALKALEVLGLSENCSSPIKKLEFFNLIITDYCMPEMTGYDLLKRVKAQTSALRDIPIVIMSSENDSNRIRSCLAEGAEEFIIKPVKLADVKRLRGHMRPLSTTSSAGSSESSGSSCGKRKAESRDSVEVTSSERRPRLKEVLVA